MLSAHIDDDRWVFPSHEDWMKIAVSTRELFVNTSHARLTNVGWVMIVSGMVTTFAVCMMLLRARMGPPAKIVIPLLISIEAFALATVLVYPTKDFDNLVGALNENEIAFADVPSLGMEFDALPCNDVHEGEGVSREELDAVLRLLDVFQEIKPTTLAAAGLPTNHTSSCEIEFKQVSKVVNLIPVVLRFTKKYFSFPVLFVALSSFLFHLICFIMLIATGRREQKIADSEAHQTLMSDIGGVEGVLPSAPEDASPSS